MWYLISIGIYIVGIALLSLRYKVNKKEINASNSKEGKLYIYVRFIALGLIPIINIIISITWLWWALLTTKEDFIKKMNE